MKLLIERGGTLFPEGDGTINPLFQVRAEESVAVRTEAP